MKLTIKKGIDVDINNIAYNIYLPPSEMFEIIKLRQELNILQTELDNLIAKELNDGKEVSDIDFKRFTKETTKIYEKILKYLFGDKVDEITPLIYNGKELDYGLANQIILPILDELQK